MTIAKPRSASYAALALGIVLSARWTGAQAPSPSPTPAPRFSEQVEVARVLIDLRVVDARGAPVQGLTDADLRVEVDGKPVEPESLQWVATDASSDTVSPEVTAPETLAEAEARLAQADTRVGRLLVLFFQKDLERSRLPGLLRMRRRAAELVAGLGPRDHVALLSFDSQLRLWLDFTADRARVQRTLERFVMQARPPRVVPGEPPSLAEYFDHERARRAATMETALRVLAEALESVDGAKSLLLFGGGLGRLAGRRVVLENDYAPALQALSRARVSVFSFDLTEADYHDLEFGLQAVAADTGGFYARTHEFAGAGLQRLERALRGYYVLALPAPAESGTHRLRVRLVGRKGEVLVQPTFES